MAIFSKVSENGFVSERHPLSKAISWSILHDIWQTVRDRMSVSIIH